MVLISCAITLAIGKKKHAPSKLFGFCLFKISEMMVVRFMQTNFLWLSLQEMAPKKFLSKKARKDAAGEGFSAAPQADIEFDGHRLRSEEHQRRFEAIKSWSFLKERWVQLREREYTEFQEEIARRQWNQLPNPNEID